MARMRVMAASSGRGREFAARLTGAELWMLASPAIFIPAGL
jgi:hypothetical protein